MAKTDATVSCVCGKVCSAMGIKSHERNCSTLKEIRDASAALPSQPAPPAAPAPSLASLAQQLNAARNGAPGSDPPPAIGTQTHAPAMKVVSADGSIDGDRPPIHKAERLDELSKRIGAMTFQAGTTNRWDWCREGYNVGVRHTFSRWYPPAVGVERNLLVDVYPERSKVAVSESAHKAKQIEARNAKLAPEDRWGYLAFIRAEGDPSDTDIARLKAGECVPLSPVRPRRAEFAPPVLDTLPVPALSTPDA